MQAVIMAAGVGSRIKELSNHRPKPLLPINNKPIIEHQVSMLLRQQVKKIIVVVGYKKNLIEEALAGFPIQYVYNPSYRTTNVLGSFWFALPHLKDGFFYAHGDTMFEQSILDKLRDSSADLSLAIDRKFCGEEEMKVKLENNHVVEINKTMNPKNAHGEFIGIAKISAKALSPIKATTEKFIKEGQRHLFFESVIQEIINDGSLLSEAMDITGAKWNEIDTPEDYNQAIELFL
ncbi:phosphocholine cytidylyltransferase family protein [Patescibacteria group bacterium AH-259-L07]|nr:phosphocholine cytidylyltransferase family protein [Patescibacteria group bacterium AH-259-L07]